MLKAPPRLLMAVYNEIEHDGRVLRAAEALADVYDITLHTMFLREESM